MPVIIKDYSWREDENYIYITLPLKGTRANKVDIFSTNFYLKAAYPPYLCEIFLKSPIKDEESITQIGDGEIFFKLEKESPEIWENLQIENLDDKNNLRRVREEAIKFSQERSKQRAKDIEEKKRETDKLAISEQMDLEQQERQRIENIKISEKKKMLQELEDFKLEQQELDDERKLLEMHKKKYTKRSACSKPTKIFDEPKKKQPLRESGTIKVSFTKRVFPTAARESQYKEEQEWLEKQNEAKKRIELEDEDLTEEEKNPEYLKEKANNFFIGGDFQSAIAVLSHAIRLNPKLPSLYSNRAACHLKVRNLFKCLEDSSKALELLTPAVNQNAESRLKAHVRRGTAFCELECYVEALQDYEAALKITPENQKLLKDAENIRQIIQSSSK